MKRPIALLIATTAALALAACSDEDDPDARQDSDIPESAEFNQADVDFATDMIQHHAQALSMVDLTRGREISPELQQLADDILMTQAPEIEDMTDWLTDWDQPIPPTVRDHANAHGDMEDMEDMDEMDSDMPGMMSAEDMAALEDAPDGEFEDRWLEMMIEHHEGAIEMAVTEQEEGEYADAIGLAKRIEAAQAEEVDLMEDLLAG